MIVQNYLSASSEQLASRADCKLGAKIMLSALCSSLASCCSSVNSWTPSASSLSLPGRPRRMVMSSGTSGGSSGGSLSAQRKFKYQRIGRDDS
jgi:hypothetical protein